MMKTLTELKTEYTEAQAAQERAYKEEEAELQGKQAAEVMTRFPDVCSYLARREGVDISELVQYGRIEGDWYSSGELDSVTFFLALPEHSEVSIRLWNPNDLPAHDNAKWKADRYNSYLRLAPALIRAAEEYQGQVEYEQEQAHEAEEYQIEKALKAHEARRDENEKQQLFDQIAGNPAALLLLKLFIQIQKDAEAFDSQIASAEAAQADAEYWHEEQMATAQRKIREAASEADEANRIKQSLEYERNDLEDRLSKVRRQCR